MGFESINFNLGPNESIWYYVEVKDNRKFIKFTESNSMPFYQN